MNYVIAAWLSCGALLALYSLRTLRRERALQRLMGNEPRRVGSPAGQSGAGAGGVRSNSEAQWH
ncbi:MAG: hypothetical protein M0005_18430 [Actinomycetota bacterium]|nr:hypothetical protein [Actinomycetota bacterium]